ncbi:MAG TPA: hypothetical protein VFG89_07890 [Coriobacteriia bacterium]|nr:hypothetical protein [Coriobacteriia bacterium]
MKQSIRWALGFVLIIALVALCGCSGGGGSSAGKPSEEGPPKQGDSAATSAFELDSMAAITREVTAEGGGGVAIKPTKDSIVRVNFPAKSLAKDSPVVVTPLKKAPVEGTLAAGCMVSGPGGATLQMSGPAFVTYTVAGELPKDTAIIRYSEDGKSFEALPSTVETNGKATVVTAAVDHFSPFGLGKGSRKNDGTSDYNWVVHVNDTYTFSDAMTQKLTVNLTATNTSGKLTGNYKGTATSTTSGSMTGAKGSAKNVGSAKGSIKFYMTSYIEDPLAPVTDESQPDPLASLTGVDVPDKDKLAPLEPEDPNLAPLEPTAPKDDGPPKPPGGSADLQGEGSITMGGQGTATATAKGVSKSAGHGSSDTLAVTVFVSGPQVYLYCSFPDDLGRATFKGYLLGEGKKK